MTRQAHLLVTADLVASSDVLTTVTRLPPTPLVSTECSSINFYGLNPRVALY